MSIMQIVDICWAAKVGGYKNERYTFVKYRSCQDDKYQEILVNYDY